MKNIVAAMARTSTIGPITAPAIHAWLVDLATGLEVELEVAPEARSGD
jgi:hypothetical protein